MSWILTVENALVNLDQVEWFGPGQDCEIVAYMRSGEFHMVSAQPETFAEAHAVIHILGMFFSMQTTKLFDFTFNGRHHQDVENALANHRKRCSADYPIREERIFTDE